MAGEGRGKRFTSGRYPQKEGIGGEEGPGREAETLSFEDLGSIKGPSSAPVL